ncbi:hypothetical protein D3C75_1116290 [compost metagenome]
MSDIKVSHWTPEQIEEHCRKIGPDKRLDKPHKSFGTMAPQKRNLRGGRGYQKNGGKW